jgi:amino acid transporter/nucleotide-binding universal stress UspA family protein
VSESFESHRPRNVDWKRAAAILYGDWGTSKAYVIGLAFVAAGFGSFPLILAVTLLAAFVGFNYLIICRHFPDGGGVYSAARGQSRLLAVVGALLLLGGLTVTASLSGWAAFSYLGVPTKYIAVSTIGLIVVLGFVNRYGPRHSGSLAVLLAIPTVVTVMVLILLALPHLTTVHFEPPSSDFGEVWIAFTGIILALSGVEVIANLTGVMTLNPGSNPAVPVVTRTATKTLLPVAVEVTLGTIFLGWAMLSLAKSFKPQLIERKEDMLRFLGEHYATLNFGPAVGTATGYLVGVVFALLLISAVNTAILAIIGLLYMMAKDGEMPEVFTRLNRFGVPSFPLLAAVLLPTLTLVFAKDFEALAGLYAIGVVGAIAVNMGSTSFNRKIDLHWAERGIMGITFLILFAIEVTLAKTKPDALFFVVCLLGCGLAMRAYTHKLGGLKTVTLKREIAEMVTSEAMEIFHPQIGEGQRLMVAAQGLTPVMSYALDEAQIRKAVLYVLFVKRIAVFVPGALRSDRRQSWEDDPRASAIMSVMMKQGIDRDVPVVPVFAASDDPATIILDVSATLGVDFLFLGASQRQALSKMLQGDIISRVASGLPENIRLVIYG